MHLMMPSAVDSDEALGSSEQGPDRPYQSAESSGRQLILACGTPNDIMAWGYPYVPVCVFNYEYRIFNIS